MNYQKVLAYTKAHIHTQTQTLHQTNVAVPSSTSNAEGHRAPIRYATHDGDKFPGGFGDTQLFLLDYWQLRARSSMLFRNNLYARGIIRRLITNKINTGLVPEGMPDEEIIGVPEDSLEKWTNVGERRFKIWGDNPALCDWKGLSTFPELQAEAHREALVDGDILVVLRNNPLTGITQVQLIRGDKIRTPFAEVMKTNSKINHGVETDKQGRVLAYWSVQDENGIPKRIPARASKTGRLVAWLVFGTDKRLDDVRGEPLLSIVLQSLRELDRYRDSAQRKAVVNSMIAMFIRKTNEAVGSKPIAALPGKRGIATVTNDDGGKRDFKVAEALPGVSLDVLQAGEEPVMLGGKGTDVNLGDFEEIILRGLAWANQIPPEILKLGFSSNYSAAQGAINEFKIYLNMFWNEWGAQFCQPIRVDWLISESLRGTIKSPAMLEAWRDPSKQDVFGAWIAASWYGSIKPSADVLKQAKGSKMLVAGAWSTNKREARGNTGTNFYANAKSLAKENAALCAAEVPLAEFELKYGYRPGDGKKKTPEAPAALSESLEEYLEDYLQENIPVAHDE